MILTKEEEARIFEILAAEIEQMADLYTQLFGCASQLMHIHAPKEAETQMDSILFRTLFFRTVGLIGGCAVKSGSLSIPNFEGPAAIYVLDKTK